MQLQRFRSVSISHYLLSRFLDPHFEHPHSFKAVSIVAEKKQVMVMVMVMVRARAKFEAHLP